MGVLFGSFPEYMKKENQQLWKLPGVETNRNGELPK